MSSRLYYGLFTRVWERCRRSSRVYVRVNSSDGIRDPAECGSSEKR
jgi:hypothetical protein